MRVSQIWETEDFFKFYNFTLFITIINLCFFFFLLNYLEFIESLS
jgi:hypothetical protein